jgi:calcineurin-like phosphoesterase family protein
MSRNQPPSRPSKKIWIGSDFHYERLGANYGLVEFKDDIPEDAPYDYMMIVGDLNWSSFVAGTLAAIYRRTKVPILYTPGNHEFWDGRKRGVDFDEQVAQMRSDCAAIEGVTFLFNEGFDVPETNSSIFMAPWFTNLSDYDCVDEDGEPIPQYKIEDCIGDYHRTTINGGSRLRAVDHVRMNKEAVHALGTWLETDVLSKGRIPIIGTHFGPSKLSAHGDFPHRDIVASYFNTDYLDHSNYIWPKGSTWIHGHTHWNVDYEHPTTGVRVVTNQLGYKGEASTNATYDFMKHIEVY